MLLYDAKGEAYNVPHAIDAKDWLATGKFFVVNPKDKTENIKEAEKSLLSELGIRSK